MSPDSQSRQLVVFTLGGEYYALPIQQVHEIIRFHEPRSVASEIAWIRGVISLRGRIIPVYDLALRLGVQSQPGAHSKIVIVEVGADTAGLIVEDVEEVLTVGGEQIDAAPGANSSLVDAIVKVGEKLVVLLKPGSIIHRTELAAAA